MAKIIAAKDGPKKLSQKPRGGFVNPRRARLPGTGDVEDADILVGKPVENGAGIGIFLKIDDEMGTGESARALECQPRAAVGGAAQQDQGGGSVPDIESGALGLESCGACQPKYLIARDFLGSRLGRVLFVVAKFFRLVASISAPFRPVPFLTATRVRQGNSKARAPPHAISSPHWMSLDSKQCVV